MSVRFWRSAGHFGASFFLCISREICTVPSLYRPSTDGLIFVRHALLYTHARKDGGGVTHVYTRSSSRVGWRAEVRESTPDQTPGPSLLFTSLPIYSLPISNLSSSSHNVIYYAKHNYVCALCVYQ